MLQYMEVIINFQAKINSVINNNEIGMNVNTYNWLFKLIFS